MKIKLARGWSVLVIAMLLAACTGKVANPPSSNTTAIPLQLELARDKIQHIIIILQENRSFDHYFGTYPGTDGIPMQNGKPTVCSNDPVTGQCIKPFHDPNDINYGGPHGQSAAITDINGGKMDGFVQSVMDGRSNYCVDPNTLGCTAGEQGPDAMGWHDAREIPNY
ncbi:MAG: alkaline phosphatase family protein, partial [Anaerolineaceae bacterium]